MSDQLKRGMTLEENQPDDYDGFKAGDVCAYSGVLFDKPVVEVTVVKWEPDRWMAEGCVGNFRRRPGLVPVFYAGYPNTRFWWAAPHQLNKLE